MEIGWGTIAYGVTAGIFFGVALVFFLFSQPRRRRGNDRLMMSFGVYALSIAISTVVTVRLHQSSSMDDYSMWFKMFGITSLLSFVAIVALAVTWTHRPSRLATLTFGLATGVVGVLLTTLPNGLLAGDITALRDVTLFNEQFVVHEASVSPWRPVLDLYLIGSLAYAVTAVVRGFRVQRTPALVVAAVVIATGALSYYDSLVDLGVVDTPYLAPFGGLATVLAGALFLEGRSARTDQRLHDQTVRLEETVIEHTAALVKANRRLEAQLAQQRRSTRSLAALTEEFERSNAMVEPTATVIDKSLRALLDLLGVILPAAVIDLHLDARRGQFDDLLPRSLSWRHSDQSTDGAAHAAVSEPIAIGSTTFGELVARPVTERDFTADDLRYLALTAEHLASLVHRFELVARATDTAVESERQRIAMDLHDSVTQRMYSVSFLADAVAHEARLDPTGLAESTDRIRELVLLSLAELRTLLLELSPRAFEDNALPALLIQLVESLASTSEASIVIDCESVPPMPTTVKTAFYRITQEALSNACRHSGADQIAVSLSSRHDTATLMIHDNGSGFDLAATPNSSGIRNIRTRAQQIGADFDITSSPTTGTTITLHRTTSEPGVQHRQGVRT